jgi:2-keto-3-deoxy-L-rhamnonate aldolase RhmA
MACELLQLAVGTVQQYSVSLGSRSPSVEWRFFQQLIQKRQSANHPLLRSAAELSPVVNCHTKRPLGPRSVSSASTRQAMVHSRGSAEAEEASSETAVLFLVG